MIGGPVRIDGIIPNTQIAPEKSQGKTSEKREEVLTKDQVTVSESAKIYQDLWLKQAIFQI